MPEISDETREFYATIGQLQMCESNTGVDLAFDARAAAKMQETVKSVSAVFSGMPPFPPRNSLRLPASAHSSKFANPSA